MAPLVEAPLPWGMMGSGCEGLVGATAPAMAEASEEALALMMVGALTCGSEVVLAEALDFGA